jgi:hypothetical protein
MDPDAVAPARPAPDPDSFVVLDDEAALERIRAAAAARTPFSLLRLGDGEAVLLSIDESAWLQDLEQLHRHWGAEGVTLGDVLRVRRDLEAGIADADLVGLRPDVLGVTAPDDLLARPLEETGDFVRKNFELREPGIQDLVARRLALANRVMTRLPKSPDQDYCSSWIHWEMLAHGLIDELLDAVDEVVLVTTHPELGPVVAEKFGVQAHVITVPGKFVDTGRSGVHVPTRYDQMRAELSGFAPGTLALVGAGIPGKVYCHWLKEAGCVALDVGATFDAWIGRASRTVVLRHRFGVADGRSVPADLQIVERVPDEPAVEPSSAPAARRLQGTQARLERANRQRMKAERQRDAARRELAALRGRRSVRAALAAARLFRRPFR